MLGIRQRVGDKPRDGGQRRQIPGGRVVPDRKERLDIGGHCCGGGVNHAITAQTPLELVVEPQVLAANLHVVTPAPLVRGSEVVAKRLCVLKDVLIIGADGVAAQTDHHR